PAYGPQNDVTLKMPAFEWVHVQLHQQKGMISLSPPTICNSAVLIMINKIDFKAKNLTSNAGLFLLLENAKSNGIFDFIENDLV
ncbi:hypothetical protein, partial [Escherichia coli]|uniref:hypothetical protein n=1 Tax=Escherichia coli TaxID=562 RepID=UPI00403CC058